MKEENCIFCAIVDGKIPSYKIYEDETCYAFLDISGDVEGHTLVVPKKHFENSLDCDQTVFCKVMQVAQKIAKHYVKNCGYTGANIAINNGKSAEQMIPHLHVHVIPRKSEDQFSLYAKLPQLERDLPTIQSKLKLN